MGSEMCIRDSLILCTSSDDDLAIISYYSRRFSASQRRYSPTSKECYAVVLTLQHWRPYLWGQHFTVITDHAALRYLYAMQDTSNMLTRWAISLQSFDFTVQHQPGRFNVIPDMLSRLVAFVQQELQRAPAALALICRNVPDNPALHGGVTRNQFQLSMDNMNSIAPVMSDRELFLTEDKHISATHLFMSIDPDKVRAAQEAEYAPYMQYLRDDSAALPPRETTATMSYFFLNQGLLYKSYLPGHIRKRSTFRDQLVIPQALIKLVLHACHDHALSGGHLAFKPTSANAIGGQR